jgi:uncharacterized protein
VRELLTADWRNLLFVSYMVEPQVLRPLLPQGTAIDTWDGYAWLSLVAYQFRSVKVAGVPVPGHQAFEGLNLRFYVRRRDGGQERPGVVFLSEIAPRALMATLTRLAFNEPYSARPMRSSFEPGPPLRLEYAWQAGERWQGCSALADGVPVMPAPSSLEGFLTGRHWSYTRQPDGSTIEYRVDHSPWRVWPATAVKLEADFTSLYGPEIAPLLREPASLLIAEGSPVRVYWPKRLADGRPAREPWRAPQRSRGSRRKAEG